jgi:hypothetical protein
MSLSLSALERKILEIVHADNRRGRRSTLATIEIALDEEGAKRVGNSAINKACWDLERLGLLATVKPAVTISDKGCTVLGKPVETPKAVVVEAPPEPVQAKAPVMPPPPALRPASFARISGETKLQTTVRLLSAYPDGLTAPEARVLTGLDLSGSLSQLRNVEETVFAFYRDGESKLTYKLLPVGIADDARPDVAPVADAGPTTGPATAEGVDTSAVVEVAPVDDALPPMVVEMVEAVADAIASEILSPLAGLDEVTALNQRIAELEAAVRDAGAKAVVAAAEDWIREVVLDLSEALGVNVEAADLGVAWTDLLDEVRRRKPVQRIIEEARQRLTSTHSAQMNCLHGAEALLGVR